MQEQEDAAASLIANVGGLFGAGRPTLSWARIPKILKVSGTARNWNSVTKMLEMAEKMEAAK